MLRCISWRFRVLGLSLVIGCATLPKARPSAWAHTESLVFHADEEDECSQTLAMRVAVGRARLEWSEDGNAQLTFDEAEHSVSICKTGQRRMESHDSCSRTVFTGRVQEEGEMKRILLDRVDSTWYRRDTPPARRAPPSRKTASLQLICRSGLAPEGIARPVLTCEAVGPLNGTPLRERATALVFARAGEARLEIVRVNEDSSFRYSRQTLDPWEIKAIARCEFGR